MLHTIVFKTPADQSTKKETQKTEQFPSQPKIAHANWFLTPTEHVANKTSIIDIFTLKNIKTFINGANFLSIPFNITSLSILIPCAKQKENKPNYSIHPNQFSLKSHPSPY